MCFKCMVKIHDFATQILLPSICTIFLYYTKRCIINIKRKNIVHLVDSENCVY